jgi:hypothetical protein
MYLYRAKYILICNFLIRVDDKLTLGSLCRLALLLASIFGEEVVLIALATTIPKTPAERFLTVKVPALVLAIARAFQLRLRALI